MIRPRHTHRLAFAVAALAVCGALADGDTPVKALKLDGNANGNGQWLTNLNAIVMDATGSIELPGAGVTTTVTATEVQVDGDTFLDFANRELAHAGLLIQGMPATDLTNGAALGSSAVQPGEIDTMAAQSTGSYYTATASDARYMQPGGLTLAVDSADYYGWETGEGPTTNNALVFVGYSSASATNAIDTCWAAYSSQITLQSKYAYAFAPAPWGATAIGSSGVVVMVRSSSTGSATNQVDVLLGDAQGYTNIYDCVSSTANEWRSYQLTAAQLPSAWTSGVPSCVYNGAAVPGLAIQVGMYSSHSNTIAFPKVMVDWD